MKDQLNNAPAQTTDATPVNRIIDRGLDTVLLFVPRLDLFAQTRWIIYGPEADHAGFLALQSAVFLAVVLTAAVFDLKRKQF